MKNLSGTYTDSFGEQFVVYAAPPRDPSRNRYDVESADDGSSFRCSEVMLREWLASGYFRRAVAMTAPRTHPRERSAAVGATIQIGGR
jgi:hypothetical protein